MACEWRLTLSSAFDRPHPSYSYVDFFKCVNAKGEDHLPCKQFYRAYNSLCPSAYSAIVYRKTTPYSDPLFHPPPPIALVVQH